MQQWVKQVKHNSKFLDELLADEAALEAALPGSGQEFIISPSYSAA